MLEYLAIMIKRVRVIDFHRTEATNNAWTGTRFGKRYKYQERFLQVGAQSLIISACILDTQSI